MTTTTPKCEAFFHLPKPDAAFRIKLGGKMAVEMDVCAECQKGAARHTILKAYNAGYVAR